MTEQERLDEVSKLRRSLLSIHAQGVEAAIGRIQPSVRAMLQLARDAEMRAEVHVIESILEKLDDAKGGLEIF